MRDASTRTTITTTDAQGAATTKAACGPLFFLPVGEGERLLAAVGEAHVSPHLVAAHQLYAAATQPIVASGRELDLLLGHARSCEPAQSPGGAHRRHRFVVRLDIEH